MAVGAGKAVPVWEGDGVDTEADTGGLGDVFEKLHLPGLPVVADPVDVVSHAMLSEHSVFLDTGLQAVHENVVPALGGVNEFKAFVGVAAVSVEGGEVVGDGAGVPVVPVGDPGKGFLGAEVDGVGAAAKFLRGQVDVFPEGFPDALVDRVLDLNSVHHLGGLGRAGKVAGESGTGQSGETGKAVVKKTPTRNFREMWVLHSF